MEQAVLVARQVALIFIYVAIGMVCTKRGILNEKTGRSLSDFSLSVITPLLIIKYYVRPIDAPSFQGLGLAFFLALLFHGLATAGAVLLIKKREGEEYRIERLAVILSNCGYMAIPLIRVTAGEIGVFYAVAYICVFNIFLFSAGMMLLTGERKLNPRRMFLNPGFIGFFVGLVLYLTQLPVPALILEAMDAIIVFNTPLPMITTGIFLVGIRWKETFTNPRIYYGALLRLIVFPLAMIGLMKLAGVQNWLPDAHNVILVVGLGCACPSAAAVTLLPAKHGLNGQHGAQFIAVTTVLSILTLPLMTLLINTWM
ncbi:AEC family transporter [Ruminococcaceae bacterium OttesenSCG-928-L11]|nr:AEC family transporter [Ruminococcaceae bacterium OttesenSCG-928-L11]